MGQKKAICELQAVLGKNHDWLHDSELKSLLANT